MKSNFAKKFKAKLRQKQNKKLLPLSPLKIIYEEEIAWLGKTVSQRGNLGAGNSKRSVILGNRFQDAPAQSKGYLFGMASFVELQTRFDADLRPQTEARV